MTAREDRILVEIAAAACGIRLDGYEDGTPVWFDPASNRYIDFNPLTKDSDAFRVMVACGLTVYRDHVEKDDPEGNVSAYWRAHPMWAPALCRAEQEGRDARAAARRAIVLAAEADRLRYKARPARIDAALAARGRQPVDARHRERLDALLHCFGPDDDIELAARTWSNVRESIASLLAAPPAPSHEAMRAALEALHEARALLPESDAGHKQIGDAIGALRAALEK
jgi:hypothetical protein